MENYSFTVVQTTIDIVISYAARATCHLMPDFILRFGVILCFVFSARVCLAEPTFPLEANSYTIGVQNIRYFPHYDFTDADKNSYLEQVLILFEEKTQIEINAVSLPIKRLEKAFFEDQSLDLIYPANPRWYAKKPVTTWYSNKLITTISGTMVLQTGQETSDIRSISIPFGFEPVKWTQDPQVRHLKTFGVPDALQALRMVESGRVQAADVELNVALHLNQYLATSLVIDTDLPAVLIDFSIATVKHPELITRWNEFLIEYVNEIDEIKATLGIIETL